MWSSTRPGVPTTTSAPRLQILDLLADRLAAVDGHDVDRACRPASLTNSSRTCTASSRVGTRTRACGRALAVRLELFEDRDGEGGRLARAGAGLAHHVDAGQRAGNQAGLDRRRLEIPASASDGEHRLGKPHAS